MLAIRHISESETAGLIARNLYRELNGFPFTLRTEIPYVANKYRKNNIHVDYIDGPALNRVKEVLSRFGGLTMDFNHEITLHLHWLSSDGISVYAGTSEDHGRGTLRPAPHVSSQLVYYEIAETTVNRAFTNEALTAARTQLVMQGAPEHLFEIRDGYLRTTQQSFESYQWAQRAMEFLSALDI